jgi:hypothetical protein
VKLALPAQLDRPAPRAHKASKDPSVPRVPSGSGGRLALRERPDQSDRRVRRAKPVAKAQSAPPANADRWERPDQSDRRGKPAAKAQPDPLVNADRQDRKAPLAHPAPPDQRVRRVIPVRQQQFASLLVRIASAVETTKSWPVLFARAVRPTERSARPLARQQPAYVCVGDLGESRQAWERRERPSVHVRVTDLSRAIWPSSCFRSLSIDENSQFEGSSRRVENPTEQSSSVDTKGPQKKDMAPAPLPSLEAELTVVPKH